jgi:fructokinase
MRDILLGLDIGGTKTELCLVRLSEGAHPATYVVLGSQRFPTEPNSGLDSFLKRLSFQIDRLLEEQGLGRESVRGTGIGVPGALHPQTGVLSQSSIPFLSGLTLKDVFEAALPDLGPSTLENDANCFALAEARLGAGAEWAGRNGIRQEDLCMLGVTLGTGVGGGIIMNGRLIRGKRGGAGEIGHSTLFPSGRPCYCRKLGCAEQYLSGGGLEQSYFARTSGKERLSAREIFRRLDEANPFALATVESYREDLTTFLSNVSNILDPHVIVLGGGLSTQDRLYAGLEERLKETCFLTENPPSILKHRIGDSAGMIGAALLAHETAHHSEDA